MTTRSRIAVIASCIAILGGMTTVAFADADSAISRTVSNTGILVSLGALLTALGTQIQPIIRIYLDNQRLQYDVQTAVSKAANERHKIMERIIYNESRVNHLYEKLLPGEPHPSAPPELPPERSPDAKIPLLNPSDKTGPPI